MERVQFIEHKGKQVLVIDFQGCTAEEMYAVVDQVEEVVTAQPRGSVLLVADYTGTRVTKETAARIKEATARDVPYVKHAAWVGVEAIPAPLFRAIEAFSTRKFVPFKTRADALDWLVEQN